MWEEKLQREKSRLTFVQEKNRELLQEKIVQCNKLEAELAKVYKRIVRKSKTKSEDVLDIDKMDGSEWYVSVQWCDDYGNVNSVIRAKQ